MLPGMDGFQLCRWLPVLAQGDLRLDPASKQAWRDGTELHLSPKEYSLLEFFLRHPGQVLTRSAIIEAVWDFAYDGESNVVDQYVNYLRRKIDARSADMTWRRSGAWVTGCADQDPDSQMPIRLRLAVAFAVIAAALYALGGWLFASGLSPGVTPDRLSPMTRRPGSARWRSARRPIQVISGHLGRTGALPAGEDPEAGERGDSK
jgi:hypothetical protein